MGSINTLPPKRDNESEFIESHRKGGNRSLVILECILKLRFRRFGKKKRNRTQLTAYQNNKFDYNTALWLIFWIRWMDQYHNCRNIDYVQTNPMVLASLVAF